MLLAGDSDKMKALRKEVPQEVFDDEMIEFLTTAFHERTDGRKGERASDSQRRLVTRIGTIEIRVPRNCSAAF